VGRGLTINTRNRTQGRTTGFGASPQSPSRPRSLALYGDIHPREDGRMRPFSGGRDSTDLPLASLRLPLARADPPPLRKRRARSFPLKKQGGRGEIHGAMERSQPRQACAMMAPAPVSSMDNRAKAERKTGRNLLGAPLSETVTFEFLNAEFFPAARSRLLCAARSMMAEVIVGGRRVTLGPLLLSISR